MRVLVTGAGGFLGSAIAAALVHRGDHVVGLARGEYPKLAALGAEFVRGDIRDRPSLSRACQGVDAVIHTAAVAGVWGPWEHYHSINTLGTQNVIAACLAAKVPILVHCSSPSVTFDGRHQSGIDESVPYAARHLCHYSHTKALAEAAVLAAHQPGVLHTAALRPHLIWGAGDPHLLPRLIERSRAGRLMIVGDGLNRIDTVHVANAAAAHLNALDRLADPHSAAGGRAFFITQDEPVRCWDWIAALLELAGCPAPRRRIGFGTAWRIGAAFELAYRAARIHTEPPMTRFVAAQLARDHYFDISAAREMLGYVPSVTTQVGLDELRDSLARGPKNRKGLSI
ncbi:MAG: NAD-dependent epimerase/dehydratase family protein [Planctomycetaceae bacterium]